jgi:hypothetical protein
VNETSWAHVWRLHSHYLGMGYDILAGPAKVGRGGPSWLMSAATSLAQVGALVKSMLQLAPSPMWLFVCVAQSSRHRGLPAHW